MTTKTMRDKLLEAGAKNLREFGYPEADTENILTDPVFSAFFKTMLEQNRGRGGDADIDSLLAQIAINEGPTMNDNKGTRDE